MGRRPVPCSLNGFYKFIVGSNGIGRHTSREFFYVETNLFQQFRLTDAVASQYSTHLRLAGADSFSNLSLSYSQRFADFRCPK